MHKRRSTQFWLRWLVIVCIVPAWAATAFFIVMSYERGRDIKKVDTIATARALMQTVDGELARTTSALQILATAPSLAAGNLADFYAQSREGLRAMAAVNVVLIDPSGQQILNTLRPLGAKLPPDSLYSRLPLVFTEDKPVITDLFSGPVTGRPMTAVAVPVIHDGRTVYELGAGIPPEAIAEVLRRQNPPQDWVISIFDRTGTIVARTHSPEQFVGKKGAAALVRRMAESAEDTLETETLEGIRVLVGFSRSSLSGWSVAIGTPTASVTSDLRRWLWLSLGATGAVLLLGLFGAHMITNRIARSIRALRQPALALALGEPVSLPETQIDEAAEVAKALVEASGLLAERAADRLKAERAERQAEVERRVAAKFSALLNAAPDAMLLVRGDSLISFANAQAERVFGYRSADLVGQPIELLVPRRLGAAHRAHVAAFFRTPTRRDMGAGLALSARRSDDEELPVEVSLSPIEIDGEPCVIAAVRDITERKRLEASVEGGRLQLINAARLSALGTMAGGIAHEINNPLAVIHALAKDLGELAEDRGAKPNEVAAVSHEISQYVERIAKIVKSLRHIARDGANDPFADTAVSDIVDGVLRVCEERFRMHSIKLLTPEVDPTLRLACREVQIAQVLTNLLQNAFDAAMEQAGDKWVRLDVAATPGEVVLSVTDCGTGVPPDLKARIMEPFFTTKPVGRGTGLGLSLSKQIALDHGGALEVDECEGHTRFSLHLPRHVDREHHASERRDAPHR